MIPYEDLVIALQSWRAKQGLPVGQLSGALTPPPAAPPPFMADAPVATPFLSNIATPPPLAAPPEDSLDVDDAALIEEASYDAEAGDFAMAFGEVSPEPEDATSIGAPPPISRPSDTTLDEGTEVAAEPGEPSIRNEDW
jgi:hypothetical protein